MTRTSTLLGAASLCALAVLGASPAFASGTQAGSTITNTVQVNYQVGGIAQTQINASNSFIVDRKINLTVVSTDTTTVTVSPGQASAVTTFQVTNSSNATLDFALAVSQQNGGAGAHANTDNFDVTNTRMFVDTNGNGVYDAGDTQVTYLDELTADTTKTVFVVSDIPLGKATGDVAAVTLTATAREGGLSGTMGAAITATSGANTAAMDTVFADGAGSSDAANDGSYSAKDDYTVLAALLTVLKSSRIISDPVNGTTNPKFIPGATIEYCISVANAATGAVATGVTVTDPLPTTITYQSSFGILVNGTMTGTTCNADGTSGGNYTASNTTVTATLPSVALAGTRTVVFRAVIN